VNDLPYEEVLDSDSVFTARETIARLVKKSVQEKTPVALVVPRQTFAELETVAPPKFPPSINISHPRIQLTFTLLVPHQNDMVDQTPTHSLLLLQNEHSH
jgi:hypothetical protein